MYSLKQTLQSHPFLLLGLTTLGLFLLVEALSWAGLDSAAAIAAVPMRFLIVPMYVVWLPFTILAVALKSAGSPDVLLQLLSGLGLALGLVPYIYADRLLARWRRRRPSRHAAT